MPEIKVKFNRHGLGDCVQFAYLLQLYKARGHEITLEYEDNKRFVWEVAGVNLVQGEGLPDHGWLYPSQFEDLNAPDCLGNKTAHGIGHHPMPAIEGDRQALWDELCQVRLSAKGLISDAVREEAAKFVEGLPKPIICVHASGTNWRERKSLPIPLAFDLIVQLLRHTAGSVVSLDWDGRDPIVASPRCRGLLQSWGWISTDRLCALYELCDLMIGVDSGPFHVASMTDIPHLGVFRSLHPVRCCLPNDRAAYLVPGKLNQHWEHPSRADRWKFLPYSGEEPTAMDIVSAALRVMQTASGPLQVEPGRYLYRRIGYDERNMDLLPSGLIGYGAAGCEKVWAIQETAGGPVLAIIGKNGKPTCQLIRGVDGVYRGRWLEFEQMPIELFRTGDIPDSAYPAPLKRVTVVRTNAGPVFNGIGDAILLAWLAEGAKGSQHELRLHATGTKFEVLDMLGCPMHDRDEGVDVTAAYVLEQRNKSQEARIKTAADVLGITTPPKRPSVKLTDAAMEFAAQFWGDAPAENRVLLCPEVNDTSRVWPWWDKLQQILEADGRTVKVLTRENCGQSFRNLAAIQNVCDVVVAADSAHAHVAATLGRPTIVLMGPSTAAAFAHAGNVRCLSVTAQEQHCVGCSFAPGVYQKGCQEAGCVALAILPPNRVHSEINRVLEKPGMIYETYAQLAVRVREWSRRLPEFVAVAGVPRAGQIVAAMLAAERNIHLVQIGDLLAGEEPWKHPLRRNCPAKGDGDVLIVDDTVSSGQKMAELRAKLPAPHFKFAAVYAQDRALDRVDHYACRVGMTDHLFEWCWQHHWFVERSCFDLDGILCADWPHPREDGDLSAKYQEHLENAPCLIRPSFPIGEIVSARLEKYRPQTEAWLAKHGIQYKALTLAPFNTPEDRANHGGFGERKAAIYADRGWAMMFVESCHYQAELIARLTGKPVLSWPRNEFFNGVTP